MKPIGPLMQEHRLIEKMLNLIETGRCMETDTGVTFPAGVVRFFRDYIDASHHAKEELFLFKALEDKPLSEEHRRLMTELIQEHAQAREFLALIERGLAGSHFKELEIQCRKISALYRKHIEKEDHRFFFPALQYLNDDEQSRILNGMADYDRQLLFKEYEDLVSDVEKQKNV
jgi:hemerythrin-like domain-containing protein